MTTLKLTSNEVEYLFNLIQNTLKKLNADQDSHCYTAGDIILLNQIFAKLRGKS